ncbi:MAG: glycosyl hydrolase [Eubacteriales bacterium]|jgi:hypothetical protein
MLLPSAQYTYGRHEDLAAFAMPPTLYHPAYSWVWNDVITREGIREQLASMKARGIRVFYILPEPKEFRPKTMPTFTEPPYLSDDYFALYKYALEVADMLGMEAWLYDEAGWPSGSANGEVVGKNPELVCMQLKPDGTLEKVPPFAQAYPDLMKRESTASFLALTHERYKKALGNNFGSTLPICFTDEPHVRSAAGTIPWTDGFGEKFREKFGYDLTAHLPALFDENMSGEEDRKARADYKDMMGELFAENYFKTIRDWCRENGILSCGHVGGDDVAFGNAKHGYHQILRCLRYFDIPGVDVIWRQAFPAPPKKGSEPFAPRCANRIFPRYASSAANQIGAGLSVTESYAIYGAGLTYDQMRWLLLYQAVRGINLYNVMSMSYSYRDFMAGSCGRPTFSQKLPGATDLRVFNEYAARVSYLMSAGEPVADAALYLPLRDIWPADAEAWQAAEDFETLGSALERRQVSFDVADDDFLRGCQIRDGALCHGYAAYRTLYVQPGAHFPDDVREKLDAFTAAGGTVTVCEGDYPVTPVLHADSPHIRAIRRKVREGTLYLVTNEAFEENTVTVTIPGEGSLSVYDPLTGNITAAAGDTFTLTLPMGDGRFFVRGDAACGNGRTQSVPAGCGTFDGCGTRTVTLTDFRFRRLARFFIGLHDLERVPISEPDVAIQPGDWRSVTGEDFSGDALYTTTFTRPGCGCVTLDLGEVKYSCEVFLNGVSLGVRVMKPYTYALPENLLETENTLHIRVSNTAANAYVTHDFTKDYEPWQIGPYDAIERQFEKDSMPSGLYGPVTLRY